MCSAGSFCSMTGFPHACEKHQHTHADLHLEAHIPVCTYTCSQAPPLLHTVSKLTLKSPGIGRKRGNAIHFNPLIMFASSFFWRIGAPYSCLFSSSLPTWFPSFPPVPWMALTCVCKGAGVWICTVFKVRTHCKCHTVDPLCPVRTLSCHTDHPPHWLWDYGGEDSWLRFQLPRTGVFILVAAYLRRPPLGP